jgi:hypothetical protein
MTPFEQCLDQCDGINPSDGDHEDCLDHCSELSLDFYNEVYPA